MAKPIQATPELRGKEANLFIEKMHKRENSPISKIDKQIVKRILKNWKTFDEIQN